MGFHAVIPVVGAQLQKFRQVLVPYVQVYGYRSLSHSQLIYGNGCVVHQFHPPDNSSCHTFETPYVSTGRTYFAEIHSHTSTELADHGEVVNASVYTFQTVGHGVDEATGQLMIRFSGIGKCRGSHGYLQFTQQIIEFSYPLQTVVPFRHCKMEGNTQIHFLYGFNRFMGACTDKVAFDKQIQSGIVEELVTLRTYKSCCFFYFFR